MNVDTISVVGTVLDAVAGASSDFKFKLLMAVISGSESFVSILSLPLNFLLATTFWRFVGIGVAVDVDAITSHKTLPFFRLNEPLIDFSFLPYEMGLLVV